MFGKVVEALICIASSTLLFFIYILISHTYKTVSTEFCLHCSEANRKRDLEHIQRSSKQASIYLKCQPLAQTGQILMNINVE